MQEAINFVFNCLTALINLFFNRIEISPGVYIGWVFVVIFIFGIFIKSILNVVASASLGASSQDTKDRKLYQDIEKRHNINKALRGGK